MQLRIAGCKYTGLQEASLVAMPESMLLCFYEKESVSHIYFPVPQFYNEKRPY